MVFVCVVWNFMVRPKIHFHHMPKPNYTNTMQSRKKSIIVKKNRNECRFSTFNDRIVLHQNVYLRDTLKHTCVCILFEIQCNDIKCHTEFDANSMLIFFALVFFLSILHKKRNSLCVLLFSLHI